MSSWDDRSIEERNLLNPGFTATLLWYAAQGYGAQRGVPLAIGVSFLVLPFVLHRETRESLPRSTTTTLAAWLVEHPIVRARVAARAALLRGFTADALIFGGTHGLLSLAAEGVRPNGAMKKIVTVEMKKTSDEVRECAKRAEFFGKWTENAGSAETVMSLLGVRP